MVTKRTPWSGAFLAGNPPGKEPINPAFGAVTAGVKLTPGIDGRSPWARRARDVMRALVGDLGGPDNVTAAERAIVRRAAVLIIELERLEVRFAEEAAPKATDVDLYARGASHLRRLLESVGLQRRPRDVTPNRSSALLELWELEGKIKPQEDNHD
jgi:hypothetical protein